MKRKQPTKESREAKPPAAVYSRVREILESARMNVARSVNTTQVVANWLIGREIFNEQQRGHERAGYGERLMATLSKLIIAEFGRGFSVSNLEHFRALYLAYPEFLSSQIPDALRGELSGRTAGLPIPDALRREFVIEAPRDSSEGPRRAPMSAARLESIGHAARGKSWQPGQLHPNLSWTHYRTLLRVDKVDARAFYEIEAIDNNWPARELERQINSLLYERLALSTDKKGLLQLAAKGQEIQKPADVFKDPFVIEFLGLPASPRLVEPELEQALIDNLQAFLLELGKGFAFVARQERLTLEGDHFYVDLVFYHTILKCFVLIDLKIGKLTHQDLGQLQLCVNYYTSRGPQ